MLAKAIAVVSASALIVGLNGSFAVAAEPEPAPSAQSEAAQSDTAEPEAAEPGSAEPDAPATPESDADESDASESDTDADQPAEETTDEGTDESTDETGGDTEDADEEAPFEDADYFLIGPGELQGLIPVNPESWERPLYSHLGGSGIRYVLSATSASGSTVLAEVAFKENGFVLARVPGDPGATGYKLTTYRAGGAILERTYGPFAFKLATDRPQTGNSCGPDPIVLAKGWDDVGVHVELKTSLGGRVSTTEFTGRTTKGNGSGTFSVTPPPLPYRYAIRYADTPDAEPLIIAGCGWGESPGFVLPGSDAAQRPWFTVTGEPGDSYSIALEDGTVLESGTLALNRWWVTGAIPGAPADAPYVLTKTFADGTPTVSKKFGPFPAALSRTAGAVDECAAPITVKGWAYADITVHFTTTTLNSSYQATIGGAGTYTLVPRANSTMVGYLVTYADAPASAPAVLVDCRRSSGGTPGIIEGEQVGWFRPKFRATGTPGESYTVSLADGTVLLSGRFTAEKWRVFELIPGPPTGLGYIVTRTFADNRPSISRYFAPAQSILLTTLPAAGNECGAVELTLAEGWYGSALSVQLDTREGDRTATSEFEVDIPLGSFAATTPSVPYRYTIRYADERSQAIPAVVISGCGWES